MNGEGENSPDTLDYAEECISSYKEIIAAVKLRILIWGPGEPSSDSDEYHKKTYQKRLSIRNRLRELGHDAFFSEELEEEAKERGYNPELPLYEKIQAFKADQIFNLRVSPGAVGEFHEFWDDEAIARKTLVFYDDRHESGFSHQYDELFEELGGNTQSFEYPRDIDECNLLTDVEEFIHKIQIVKATIGFKKYWGEIE